MHYIRKDKILDNDMKGFGNIDNIMKKNLVISVQCLVLEVQSQLMIWMMGSQSDGSFIIYYQDTSYHQLLIF